MLPEPLAPPAERASGAAASCRTLTPTIVADAAQPADEERVLGQSGLRIDQSSQQLVVPCRRELKLDADRLLLGAGVSEPARLEGEQLGVALAQSVGCGVAHGHEATLTEGSRRSRTPLHGRPQRVDCGEHLAIQGQREATLRPGGLVDRPAPAVVQPRCVDRDPAP